MISYDQALDLALESALQTKVEVVRLNDAFGRVLAEDLVSPFPLPHFDNSAVDGYALGAANGDGVWRITRTIGAGDSPGQALQGNECARIFTGAATPERAFAVVMQEDIEVNGDTIRVCSPLVPGQNIRCAGEEVMSGDVILSAGSIVNAAGVGVAATLGLTHVPVVGAPRVGIVVTGAELTAPGNKLSDYCIFESNSVVLRSALMAIGLSPEFVEVIGDDPNITQSVLSDAIDRCDVLITTGGVSVGDRDVVKSALARLQVEDVFWKVAIKPGKPVYMGRRGSHTIFGLPGNPLSVLATFNLLVKPSVLAMMGYPDPVPMRIIAELASTLSHKPGRREFVPGRLTEGNGSLTISPITGQGSHMLSGMARANAFIDIPVASQELRQGEMVSVVQL